MPANMIDYDGGYSWSTFTILLKSYEIATSEFPNKNIKQG